MKQGLCPQRPLYCSSLKPVPMFRSLGLCSDENMEDATAVIPLLAGCPFRTFCSCGPMRFNRSCGTYNSFSPQYYSHQTGTCPTFKIKSENVPPKLSILRNHSPHIGIHSLESFNRVLFIHPITPIYGMNYSLSYIYQCVLSKLYILTYFITNTH